MDQTGNSRKKKKPKRKNNINKSVRNYFRSKEHLSNGDVSEEDAKYFMGILTVLREASNDESKELLATNVIEQTKGREIVLSSHQIASKVIENLLEFCSDETLVEYQEAFKADIRSLCLNGFSSHVLEKLISISAMRYLTKNSVEDEPPEKKIKTEDGIPLGILSKSKSFVETCSKFLLNNLEEFVWDSYANHVIRTCLTTLSGRILEEKVPIPGEWTEIFKEYVARLRDWPFFADFPYQELTSGLLQFLIQALARVDKNTLKSIGGFFTEPNTSETPEEDQESPSKLHKLFSTESSIRFLEVLISVAGNKLFTKILLRLFQGNFKELSLLKSANFSVQKLLDNMKNKDEFNICFTELEPHFAEILQTGHTGIILALCLACKRLEINQNQFIKSLRRALECPKEGNFAVCVLKLKPHEHVLKDSSNFIHIHGSVILQEMLNFRKPIDIIQSILSISPDQLVTYLNSAKGSFIANAFFSSQFVGEKSRVSFVNHLMNFLVDLAINKFGSRVVECLFEASSGELRGKIVAELAGKINRLQSTPFGFIVSKKLHVNVYKENAKKWNSLHNKVNKDKGRPNAS